VLSSRRLNRIVEYEAEDLTMVAQAGVTLHLIEERTHAHQQRLAADPWPGSAATLGGACAANRFGLCRLRFGSLRDAVLGARVVHADGSTTRTGGKVVKNVTGYDLAKLYVGSHGSLAFIAELNLRLVPRPHATALVHARLPFDEARRRVWEVHRSRLQPVSVVVTDRFAVDGAPSAASGGADPRTDEAHVLVRFEGRAPVVEQQANTCKQLLDGRIVPAVRAAWDELRRFTEPSPQSDLVQVSAVPTSVFDVVAAARDALHPELAFVGLFGVGTTWLKAPSSDAAALHALDERLPRGWHLRVIGAAATDCLREPPASVLQRALKSTFDPNDTLRPMPGAPHGVPT
jgi:glycolate oxidase FAD binding subunit